MKEYLPVILISIGTTLVGGLILGFLITPIIRKAQSRILLKRDKSRQNGKEYKSKVTENPYLFYADSFSTAFRMIQLQLTLVGLLGLICLFTISLFLVILVPTITGTININALNRGIIAFMIPLQLMAVSILWGLIVIPRILRQTTRCVIERISKEYELNRKRDN